MFFVYSLSYFCSSIPSLLFFIFFCLFIYVLCFNPSSFFFKYAVSSNFFFLPFHPFICTPFIVFKSFFKFLLTMFFRYFNSFVFFLDFFSFFFKLYFHCFILLNPPTNHHFPSHSPFPIPALKSPPIRVPSDSSLTRTSRPFL
jgi:hypothetical protein